MTTLPPIDAGLSPDHHPGVLKSGDASLLAAMASAYTRWGALKRTEAELDERARGTRPGVPMRKLTAADKARLDEWARATSLHKAKLADKSIPVVEKTLAGLDRAIDGARSRASAIQSRIDGSLVPASANTAYHTEIRAALKAQEGSEFEACSRAVRDGDRDVLAAVLGVPAFVVGLTDEQQATVRRIAVKEHCADDQAALEDLSRDIDRVEHMRDAFLAYGTTTVASWRSAEESIIERGLSHAV